MRTFLQEKGNQAEENMVRRVIYNLSSTLDIQACVSDHKQKVKLYKGEEILPLRVQKCYKNFNFRSNVTIACLLPLWNVNPLRIGGGGWGTPDSQEGSVAKSTCQRSVHHFENKYLFQQKSLTERMRHWELSSSYISRETMITAVRGGLHVESLPLATSLLAWSKEQPF